MHSAAPCVAHVGRQRPVSRGPTATAPENLALGHVSGIHRLIIIEHQTREQAGCLTLRSPSFC